MTARKPLKVLVYGDPGSRKSTFAETFPKPMIVAFWDQVGMDWPYIEGTLHRTGVEGTSTEPQRYPGFDFDYIDVFNAANEFETRILYFGDSDPTRPKGYEQFCRWMQSFYGTAKEWATLVVDSVTFMEIAARYRERYVTNPKSKEPRQWWAGSTDALEQMLLVSIGALRINVVVVAHASEQREEVNGQVLRTIIAPGRLAKATAAGYTETYRAYVIRNEQTKERQYVLQTQPDNLWIAKTGIDAPDPCWADYEALWTNREAP